MGKSTISMAIFNSYVKLPEGSSMKLFFYNSDLELFSSGIFHDFPGTFDFQNLPYLDPYLGIVEMTRI